MKAKRLLLLLAATVLTVPLAVMAQENVDPVVEEKAREVFLDVMSPFCPGRSLADCPSNKAHDLKDEIRNEIKLGKPKESILNSVFEKYGEEYRAKPKVEGIGIIAWFAPVIFFIVGICIISLWISKRGKVASTAGSIRPENAIDDRVAREIEQAMED